VSAIPGNGLGRTTGGYPAAEGLRPLSIAPFCRCFKKINSNKFGRTFGAFGGIASFSLTTYLSGAETIRASQPIN
jgi:hypothetical protein